MLNLLAGLAGLGIVPTGESAGSNLYLRVPPGIISWICNALYNRFGINNDFTNYKKCRWYHSEKHFPFKTAFGHLKVIYIQNEINEIYKISTY